MDKDKIIYWISTGLLSALMIFDVFLYIFNYELASTSVLALGYPTHIIYPLAVAKALGVVAIISRKSKVLTQFAYAGFMYVFILAVMAHLVAGDGMWYGAFVALIFTIVSYYYAAKRE